MSYNFLRALARMILGFLLGLVICGMLTLIFGCTRKSYVPYYSSTTRTDTLKIVDTLHTSSIRWLRDTVRETREVKVYIRDSIAPRLDENGVMTGWDRFHFEQESERSREERARLLELIDSLERASDREHLSALASQEEKPPEEIIKQKNEPGLSCLQKWLIGIATAIVAVMAFFIYRKFRSKKI